jgi:Family of unknown function (DUF6491)
MKSLLATLLCVSILLGCAGAPLRGPAVLEEYQPYAGVPVDEVRSFTLDSWQSVDRSHVVLWTGPSSAYLIATDTPCPDLGFVERLAVSSTAGRITRFDAILTRHHGRCSIREIRPLDIKAMNADRAARRAVEPH